jgi:hypothetical protein
MDLLAKFFSEDTSLIFCLLMLWHLEKHKVIMPQEKKERERERKREKDRKGNQNKTNHHIQVGSNTEDPWLRC